MPQSKPETPTRGARYLPKEGAGISFPADRTALVVIDPVTTSSPRAEQAGR